MYNNHSEWNISKNEHQRGNDWYWRFLGSHSSNPWAVQGCACMCVFVCVYEMGSNWKIRLQNMNI